MEFEASDVRDGRVHRVLAEVTPEVSVHREDMIVSDLFLAWSLGYRKETASSSKFRLWYPRIILFILGIAKIRSYFSIKPLNTLGWPGWVIFAWGILVEISVFRLRWCGWWCSLALSFPPTLSLLPLDFHELNGVSLKGVIIDWHVLFLKVLKQVLLRLAVKCPLHIELKVILVRWVCHEIEGAACQPCANWMRIPFLAFTTLNETFREHLFVAKVTLYGRIFDYELLFELELSHIDEVSEIAEGQSAKHVIVLTPLIFFYHGTLKLRDLFCIFRGLV